jgi:hypothetical protein
MRNYYECVLGYILPILKNTVQICYLVILAKISINSEIGALYNIYFINIYIIYIKHIVYH